MPEDKYFLLVSNIQLKYHLHVEAFLTHTSVMCSLLYASLMITLKWSCLVSDLHISSLIKSLRAETIIIFVPNIKHSTRILVDAYKGKTQFSLSYREKTKQNKQFFPTMFIFPVSLPLLLTQNTSLLIAKYVRFCSTPSNSLHHQLECYNLTQFWPCLPS